MSIMQIKTISEELKKKYKTKVYKLSLQTGCSCPNRDGKLSYGGCIFCSEGGSGDFASPLLPIDQQIELAKARVAKKIPASISEDKRLYIAYFQSYTNTYKPASELYPIFKAAIMRKDIVEISIGTRPDCLPDDILDMLTELNKIKDITIELGLQTIHKKTARLINRGYELETFAESYKKLKERGLKVVVHTIIGLPGEDKDDLLATMDYLNSLNPKLDGIKLQLLHILKNTKLASMYENGELGDSALPSLDEYCDLVIAALKRLDPDIVIHRITGDGPKSLLIAPLWSSDKKRVLNTLNKKIREA